MVQYSSCFISTHSLEQSWLQNTVELNIRFAKQVSWILQLRNSEEEIGRLLFFGVASPFLDDIEIKYGSLDSYVLLECFNRDEPISFNVHGCCCSIVVPVHSHQVSL